MADYNYNSSKLWHQDIEDYEDMVIVPKNILIDTADAIRAKRDGTTAITTDESTNSSITSNNGIEPEDFATKINDLVDSTTMTLSAKSGDITYNLITIYNRLFKQIQFESIDVGNSVISCQNFLNFTNDRKSTDNWNTKTITINIPNNATGAINFGTSFTNLKNMPTFTTESETIPVASFAGCFNGSTSIDPTIRQKSRWYFGSSTYSSTTLYAMNWEDIYDESEWDDFTMLHQYLDPGSNYLYTKNYLYGLTLNLSNVKNLYVIKCDRNDAVINTNMFNGMTCRLNTLHHFTFATDNGTPYVAKWNNQVLDLTQFSSYLQTSYVKRNGNYLLINDASLYNTITLEAIKEHYWTSTTSLVPYTHSAMVETINSLPDTSSYGTNTIKFKSGYSTSTTEAGTSALTAEEIAVATAKGWTVSIS